MNKITEEWRKQADYDIETAEIMFNVGRYSYAVFMCHLSVEKLLKGLYVEKQKEIPPKIHNLLYFVEKLQLSPPNYLLDFIAGLNKISVPTRYPDNLEKILRDFNRNRVEEILQKGKELILWIKSQYQK
ncbi:MAG: HEPN domain-containing protein [Firmicutes bacterium]|jgi:HEPN domain-containing protein|nr:HEPN domain-containing protein [Bacillota bacterium]